MTTTSQAPVVQTMPMIFNRDIVTVNHPRHPGEWTVHNAKRTNAVIKPRGNPGARGLDAPMYLLVKTGERAPLSEIAQHTPVTADAPTALRPGKVVRILRSFRTYSTTDLLVVAKVNKTTATLHRLGGDNPGENGVNMGPGGIKVVDLAEVTG